MKEDTRWIQRYSNYKKALDQLERFLEKQELNEMEEQGLIQEMLKDRNRTVHTYDESIAKEIVKAIRTEYIHLFTELDKNFRRWNSSGYIPN